MGGAGGAALHGLAIGVAIAVPLTEPVSGDSIPEAQEHLELVPARVLAIAGNTAGTIAAVAVALLTIRRRPRGNALLLAGIASPRREARWPASVQAESALFTALAAVLLYGGFVVNR